MHRNCSFLVLAIAALIASVYMVSVDPSMPPTNVDDIMLGEGLFLNTSLNGFALDSTHQTAFINYMDDTNILKYFCLESRLD
jgi:hypothetical protein